MNSDEDLVALASASTAFEAEWLVGALKGFDIPAVTWGDMLQDEFAMSQKVMGLAGGVNVMVPRGLLERARQALAEIEQVKPTPEELEAAAAEAVEGGETESGDDPD